MTSLYELNREVALARRNHAAAQKAVEDAEFAETAAFDWLNALLDQVADIRNKAIAAKYAETENGGLNGNV